MFEAEAAALRQLASAIPPDILRIPRPLAHGVSGPHSWLLLEHLPLQPAPNASAHIRFGTALAQLHRATSPDGRFGWHQDNTIGSTPQRNPWTSDWAAFFRDHRLAPQFDLAACRGRRFPGSAELLRLVPHLLHDHHPRPSLLHGDLWSGNAAFLPDATPAIFDPASYFGDRETDLALSRLFGGFPEAFYHAYDQAWPLPPGHELRAALYNLYHLLNHFHLFGRPYDAQADQHLKTLLQA